MTSDPLSVLVRAIGQAGDAVAGVKPDQAELPTPCRSWNVRQLIEHLIHDLEQFTKAAGGCRGDWSSPAAEVEENWVQAFQTRADALTAAWGAAELTGTTELPGLGEVPDGLPGIVGLLAFKPSTGARLAALMHEVLRGDGPLSPSDRELIAAYVSTLDACQPYDCAAEPGPEEELLDPRLRALLRLA